MFLFFNRESFCKRVSFTVKGKYKNLSILLFHTLQCKLLIMYVIIIMLSTFAIFIEIAYIIKTIIEITGIHSRKLLIRLFRGKQKVRVFFSLKCCKRLYALDIKLRFYIVTKFFPIKILYVYFL